MEDREILEKYLKIMQNDAHRNAVKRAMFEGKTEIEIIKSEEQKAIENILKENENLKQSLIINKNLYEEVCNKNKELEKKYDDLLCDVYDLFIRKSLVKEKIEELKEVADEDNREAYTKIDILQELLRRG